MSLRSREHHAFGAPEWSQRHQRFQPLTFVDRTPIAIAFSPARRQGADQPGSAASSHSKTPAARASAPQPRIGLSCRRDRATIPGSEVCA